MKYKVVNQYGLRGETTHRTAKAAILAAKKREGDGWHVVDERGARHWMDLDGRIYTDGFDRDAIGNIIIERGGIDPEWAKKHLVVLR
jgi:hypothetical protein